jgi:hypothetical protein
MRNVTGPISIGLGPQTRGAAQSGEDANRPSAAPGIVRNISFSGIQATVVDPVQHPDIAIAGNYRPGEFKTCIVLNGVDTFIENISFHDVHIQFPGGGTAAEAGAEVPKSAGEYFELGVLPAYALYARNVRDLNLSNVRFEMAKSDQRPAVVFDHVEDAFLNGLSAQGDKAAASVLRLRDSRDVLLAATRVLTPAAAFLQVEGAASQAITIDGGDQSKAATPVVLKGDAPKSAVKQRA